jgi:hypothetical protein
MKTASGTYQHHKGPLYRVLFTAGNSTNTQHGGRMVIYVSLTYGTIHAREEKEFHEQVLSPAADPLAPCWCDARGQPSCKKHPGSQALVSRFKLVKELS